MPLLEFVRRHNNVTHRTFLEELVFWTVIYEFPQELVCFLLNMLPDDEYKVRMGEKSSARHNRAVSFLIFIAVVTFICKIGLSNRGRLVVGIRFIVCFL